MGSKEVDPSKLAAQKRESKRQQSTAGHLANDGTPDLRILPVTTPSGSSESMAKINTSEYYMFDVLGIIMAMTHPSVL